MKVAKVDLPKGDEVHLYLVGDTHVGTRYHSTKDFADVIQCIKNDPVARWIGMGDQCECITPSDKRWQGKAICDWVSPDNVAHDQMTYYCDMVAPIADKCDGLLYGNHEDKIRREHHVDIHKNICEKLNVMDLSYMARLRYQFIVTATQRGSVDVLVTHGSGGAVTRAAKLARLERLMQAHSAHIFGHGHCHEIILHPGMPYLDLSQHLKLKNMAKVGAMTGCYFRTYTQDIDSSYGEMANYPPTMIGSPMFTIRLGEGTTDIKVTA